MKLFFIKLQRIALLPTLSFIFAFFIGGIIIVVSDPIIMGQLNSPGKFLTAAGARI
ncbi:MAG: ABC transporter permease, partial [Actinobacteria bacterium]|nr:ABC transporter permease [Actinomycetota bacterium]